MLKKFQLGVLNVKEASKNCVITSVSIYAVSQVAVTCQMARALMLTKPEDTRPIG